MLAPLPATRFELSDWKQPPSSSIITYLWTECYTQFPMNTSKKKVDVKITDTTIEIFYNHNRIASHRRLKGRPGSTALSRNICRKTTRNIWNGTATGSAKWAERIGINTYTVVNAILTSKRVEQQTYRSCMGLLKLAEKYSDALFEAACKKALSYTASPSYKSIKNIL